MASKGYGNVSEYCRGLVREAQARENEARLEALLLEGLASGEAAEATPEFWSDLKKGAAQLLSAQREKKSR
jgi:antitoxin ParD1/3/4